MTRGPKPAPAARPASAFSVRALTLTDFRTYARVGLETGQPPGLMVLTGPNGSGKTNVLEAISFLGPGRGLRGGKVA
ncbi:MAG: DNA replication and repair protein RecF, partial [Alphaproteobacteria bacterium]|nr:DNA replication and repair protein RecF [Alphaproteobacteria bacterium]